MGRPRRPDRYFMGNPCVHGHDGLRYLSNHACVACSQARTRRWQEARAESNAQVRAIARDQFGPLVAAAARHLRTAGKLLDDARAIAPRNTWRRTLQQHGLSQKLAAECRRYAFTDPDDIADWLKD